MVKLSVTHNAENEAGLATFLLYIKDTFTVHVLGATADSENKHCHTTLQFENFNDVLAAVQALKTQFTITYRLSYEP